MAGCMIFVAVAELEAVQSRTVSPSAAATDSAATNYSKEAWVVEKFSSEVIFQADGTGRREQTVTVRAQSAEGVRQFGVLTIAPSSSFCSQRTELRTYSSRLAQRG